MNREIKFRGKDIYCVWHHGYLFQGRTENNENYSIILKQMRYVSDERLSEDFPFNFYKDEVSVVDPNTISQFTGLYDKNGIEIYEGDIIMCVGQRVDNNGKKYYRKIIFNNGSFCMDVPIYDVLSPLRNHVVNGCIDWEVIGNIFDNPELLEDKK